MNQPPSKAPPEEESAPVGAAAPRHCGFVRGQHVRIWDGNRYRAATVEGFTRAGLLKLRILGAPGRKDHLLTAPPEKATSLEPRNG